MPSPILILSSGAPALVAQQVAESAPGLVGPLVAGAVICVLLGAAAIAFFRIRAMRALNERGVLSDHVFTAFFGDASVGIAVLDEHGAIVRSNSVFETMVGYSEEDLIGMLYFDLVDHPDEGDVRERIVGALDRFGESRHLVLRRSDGSLVRARFVVTPAPATLSRRNSVVFVEEVGTEYPTNPPDDEWKERGRPTRGDTDRRASSGESVSSGPQGGTGSDVQQVATGADLRQASAGVDLRGSDTGSKRPQGSTGSGSEQGGAGFGSSMPKTNPGWPQAVAGSVSDMDVRVVSDSFLASLHDEIRTPLTVILGSASILRAEVPELHEDLVEAIEASSRRLLDTTDGLLDLARLQYGDELPVVELFDVRAIVLEVAEAERVAAAAKRLAISSSVPSDPITARGDCEAVSRIVRQLVQNAVKFTETGAVYLHVQADAADVRVVVSDTGSGFDDETGLRLFKPFFQASHGSRRKYRGMGLGLTVAGELARRIGGTIRASGKPGEGATFTLAFPLRRALGRVA